MLLVGRLRLDVRYGARPRRDDRTDPDRQRGRGRRPPAPLHRRPRPGDRASLAGLLGRQRHVRGAEPDRPARRSRRRGGQGAEAVRARHVPVPIGGRPPRRAPSGVHRHRRLRPLPADARPQRALLDGLRRLRAARRAVRRADRPAPRDHHRHERRDVPPAAPPPRTEPRPPPLGRDHRPRLLPLDAVDLRPDLRLVVRPRGSPARRRDRTRPPDRRAARRVRGRHANARRRTALASPESRRAGRRDRRAAAGVRRRRSGELVSRPGHGDRQRGGHRRRPQRPRQLPRVQAHHAAVDDAHHGLRRAAARRPRPPRLDRLAEDDAAQLDRSLDRGVGRLPDAARADHRVHNASGHPVRGDVHGPRAGASARRRPHHVRRRPSRRRVQAAGRIPTGGRSSGREPGKDRCVHRFVRHQPGHRPGHPDLGRGLRPDGIRHRGDHGRPVRRPARFRVRQDVRSRHPGDPAPARRLVRRPGSRTHAGHDPLARGVHRRRPVRQLEQPRLGSQRPRPTSRRRSPPPTPGWRPTATARER